MANNPSKIKVWVQIIITGILSLFAIYLIATEPEDSVKLKWAFGIIGIMIGYWLK